MEIELYNKPYDFIDWIETNRSFWGNRQDEILKVIAGLEWIYPKEDTENHLIFAGEKMPTMAALALPEIVKGYAIANVTAIAFSQAFAPSGLICIQFSKVDCYLRGIFLDDGNDVGVVCMMGWTKTKLDEVKEAVNRVIQSRRLRGAKTADIISWLTGCKEGAWKNCPEIIAYLDWRINDLIDGGI